MVGGGGSPWGGLQLELDWVTRSQFLLLAESQAWLIETPGTSRS